jgi:hypothetical protein
MAAKKTQVPTEQKPVLGLDDDEVKSDRIYFRNDSLTFSVSEKAAVISKLLTSIMVDTNSGRSENNPLVFNVEHGSDEIFKFIQIYMEYFEGKDESEPPPKPLPSNTHISAIFQDEYHIFSNIVKENDTLKVKLETLNKYIIVAIYFDIKNLPTKLSAIVASLIQSKTLTQLKNLLS